MDIGVPRATSRHEHRVGVTPSSVRRLVAHGHRVFVETCAGDGSRYFDKDYREAGAEIVYRKEEVIHRSELIVGVARPTAEEVEQLREGQICFGFLHLAVAPRDLVRRMVDRKVTAIGFEVIEEDNGHLPVLTAMSELAGQMVATTAAHLLENESGGRGVLLGSVPGIAPSTIVIIGAGTVGRCAAASMLALGAEVVILDSDLGKLRLASQHTSGRAITLMADRDNIARFVKVADVLVGAVLIPGGPAPFVVTKEMVAGMQPGSVIIDASIDQGGCIETSRPTTIEDPTFSVNGVVHYCVPNMNANIARTASKALSHAHLSYVTEVATRGIEGALAASESLRRGVYMHRGRVEKRVLSGLLGTPE
jgi:alanine dehydrogenase